MNDSPKVPDFGASRPTLTLKKSKNYSRPKITPENLERREGKAARRIDASVPWGQFWIIWNPAAQRPQRRHESIENALLEVTRLREAFPSEKFHVYRCDLIP